jgi:hypothetical protein
VRQELSQHVVTLEQKLRHSSTPDPSPLELLVDATDSAPDNPLWIELRRPDGGVLARRGSPGARLFSNEEESTHFDT